MAASISVAPAEGDASVLVNVSISGATPSTAYVLEVATPEGTQKLNFTTDGSGAATVPYNPFGPGSYTFNLRSLAAYQGTTTAEATTTWTAIGA